MDEVHHRLGKLILVSKMYEVFTIPADTGPKGKILSAIFY
jgi:hypothetical protein